jgi:YD repeat-containing protein
MLEYFDNAGNMTTRDEDGTEWAQTFSPDNRLEQVTDGSDTWTFTYDGDGVRTIQENPDGTSTAFLFGGLYEVALDSQGDTTAVKRYYTSSAGRVALRDGDVPQLTASSQRKGSVD